MKLADLQRLTTNTIIVYLNSKQSAYICIYNPSLPCERQEILNLEISFIQSLASDALLVFIDIEGPC